MHSETRPWAEQAPVVLAAVATVLMLEGVRVFVAYLVFVVDQANRVALGGTALGVFAAIGFGGLVARLGRTNAILAAAAGLGLARLVLQFWQQPEARIVLGGATVICWGWLIIALLRWHRAATAIGIPLGLVLDLAIRIATGTVDLPWMPGAGAHLATVILVAVLGLAVFRIRVAIVDVGASSLSLLALGPGLAVFYLTTGNINHARLEVDEGFAAAAALLAIGVIVGILFLTVEPLIFTGDRDVPRPMAVAAIALLLTVTIIFIAFPEAMSPFILVFGTAASIGLLWMALHDMARQESGASGGIAAEVTIGMVLQAGVLFAYYTFTGSPKIAAAAWGIFLLLALLGGRSKVTQAPPSQANYIPLGAVVLMLILACGWQMIDYDEPKATTPLGSEFTVMQYNIQSGFAVDNVWSLEETARTIEAADPDIVVMQEVGRSWLVTTYMDQIAWLARRLDMEYAFGANSQDGLWGNAILSRAPILDTDRHAFDTTENLSRAVLAVEIETETGSLWVLGTHLDNPSGAGNVRLEQAEQLIDFWDNSPRTPALLVGDLNATPETDVLAFLDAAGFHDTGLVLLGDATTSQDNLRIDYILTTDGLTVTEMEVPQVWTSDHLPVVARIRVD